MSAQDNERLDRIEQHLKLLKQDSENRTQDIKEIKTAIIGNGLGTKGLVKQLAEIDERVDDLEEFKKEVSIYVNQFKVALLLIIGGIVSLIVKVWK